MNIQKTLALVSFGALFIGTVLIGGGVWGTYFTYQSVAREKIVTPADASIPSAPVRGPFTLKAQADIIRDHTLENTGGKTYAEMPRQVQKVDASGSPMFDAEGKPVMEANPTRGIWIPATTLMTALNVGVMAYTLSALVILGGLLLVCIGIVLKMLSKKFKSCCV